MNKPSIPDRVERFLLNAKVNMNPIEFLRWRKLRNHRVKEHPYCSICGWLKRLEVHHILPQHLFPALKLEPRNTVVLCRHCHFHHGHFNSFRTYNVHILEMINLIEDWKLSKDFMLLGTKESPIQPIKLVDPKELFNTEKKIDGG